MYAVIMAGGKGERLWPKTTKGKAKHMLSLGTKNVMIQETIKRLRQNLPIKNIYLVTTKSQFRTLNPYISIVERKNIILEPEGLDTAPAICLSALTLERKLGDVIMVILPADHIIKDADSFIKTLFSASKIAGSNSSLVTIGVKPKYASVGYGYIEIGEKEKHGFIVKRFVEKPKKKKALSFYKKKNYLWNSGIFICKVSSILAAFKRHMPTLYYGLKDISKLEGKKGYAIKLANEYKQLKPISIDYGVMEPAAKNKSQKIYCIKGSFGWMDIGSWSSIEEIYDKDAEGNILLANSSLIDVENSTIIGERAHKIGVIGLKDIIIVQTKSGTLVCNKNRAQEVKALVKKFR